MLHYKGSSAINEDEEQGQRPPQSGCHQGAAQNVKGGAKGKVYKIQSNLYLWYEWLGQTDEVRVNNQTLLHHFLVKQSGG